MHKINKLLVVSLSVLIMGMLSGCDNNSKTSASPSTATTPKVQVNTKKTIAVKLQLNGKAFNAVMYDTKTVQSLLKQAPVKVNLNRGKRDYCGGDIKLEYTKADVVSGYKNGDLMYWLPGKNFVIFTNGEESSAEVGDLVPLGKLQGSVSDVLTLGEQIEVVIQKPE